MSDSNTTSDLDVPQRFAHLHLHSEYSLLDGGNTVSRLVEQVKKLGMNSVAVTDHGNMHVAMELYTKARAAGIKPILGIEAYVAPGDRHDRTHTGVQDGGFHLVLLAETLAGWRNLVRLSSDAYLNGFYYKPRMDKSTLAEWSDGIIAINGHLGSSIAHLLVQHVRTGARSWYDEAVEEARWHQRTFGTNERGEPCFFVELQRHIPEQEEINPLLREIAREIDAPLVADNDAHFLRREDHDVHDTLCCISMGKIKDEPGRLRYSEELYVKSPDEMEALFPDDPEALANTVRIAERCDVVLPEGENHAPVVKVVHPGEPPTYVGGDLTEWFKAYCARFELLPFDAQNEPDVSPDDLKENCDRALRDLCEAGLIWRYGPDGVTDEIRARLERELKVLADKLISAYFLIVWDFVNWARQRGIPSLARGSGVGTMVGFVLGLSNACPVRYGLLFERFTDPDRAEYPDIDIDICQDGRGAAIDYVKEKYGHVAQIITFGRLKARAALKDVARVVGLSPGEGQRLANLVPNELGVTIDEALQKEPDLKAEYDSDARIARVIDHARALEDHARHAGVHAAGVIVATQPLDTIVPLCKASGSDDVVTQWDGPTCEKIGLLKMDFLGLRTLSTIERACAIVRDTLPDEAIWRAIGQEPPQEGEPFRPHPLDLDRIPYDDQRVLSLFRRGDTAGIFQFESGGMRKLLIDMQPDRLEDLIAANALFRPGPMDLIPDYNARKHGRESAPKVHEIVDRLTDETYGIMVYQEQVMQVLNGLGDIPLRKAYTIIKAISKKKHDVINAAREEFVAGAAAHGVNASQSNELFDLILKFAGYGFNKSHSTGYAIVAYQTAYLKTYFPAQYMAAVLTFESGAKKVEEWSVYLDDCRRLPWPDSSPDRPHVGVDVRPPDVNLSASDFTVVFDEDEEPTNSHGHIRFGLGAIKGVGKDAIRSIAGAREKDGPFTSLHDFCERVDHARVTAKSIELLVKAGALDSLHSIDARASMLATIPEAVASSKQLARDRAAGQEVLFGFGGGDADGGGDVAATDVPLREAAPWDRRTALAAEKEALGFHVSGHPLDEHAALLRTFCTCDSRTFGEHRQDAPVVVGGLLSRIRNIVTSKGDKMAAIGLEDRAGAIDAVLFPRTFAEFGSMLQPDATLLVVGRADMSRGEPQIIVESVHPIEEASARCATRVEILVPREGGLDGQRERVQLLAGVLRQAARVPVPAGTRPVDVLVHLDLEPDQTGGAAASRVTLGSSRLRAVATQELLGRVGEVVGDDCVRVLGGHVPLPERRERRRRVGA